MTGGFVIDDRGYIGGRGIARPPSSSHLPRVLLRRRCVLRWRKDCTSGLPPHTAGLHLGGRGTGLLPHNDGDFLGGGGTGPPPHSNDEYFGMGRSGDTMICEKATFCTRVQVGTARDVLRHHAANVWSSRAMLGSGCRRLGRFGDTIRLGRTRAVAQMGRSGGTMICGWLTTCTRVQVVTARDALRYHAVGVLVVRGQTGLGCRRSGRLRRHHPSGSVCTRRLGWALRAGEVLHLFAGSIRCSAVDVRTTVGLNRLGEVRVQTWMVGIQLAHIKSV